MDEGIQQLIAWIAQLAPEVWRIALRQIYTRAVLDGVWIAVMVVINEMVRLGVRRWQASARFGQSPFNEDETVATALRIGTTLLVTVMALLAISDIVSIVLNPEWQAIKLLLELAD